MSIWDPHGRIRIEVEQRHIERALERNSSHCAVAEAIKEAIPDARFIAVDLQCIRFSRANLRYIFLTPHLARDCIINFDQGCRDALMPFTLRMRPAQIAKAGKKRTHTPDATQLRGLGMSVNPVQLHIRDHEARNRSCRDQQGRNTGKAQRYTADGKRNLDPERIDGLCGGPPSKRKTRVARAMVSTASKGSVPVTLGGRAPPLSILSRREFGLRVLRR